jgi:hypothetical protein
MEVSSFMRPLAMIPRFFLPSLCAAWMIGIGLRFIFDGFFNKNVFSVNVFDVWFDWGVLVVLGLSLFIYSTFRALKETREEVLV